ANPNRTLLTIRKRRQVTSRNTERRQIVANRTRTTLTQRKVVLACATLVRMTNNLHRQAALFDAIGVGLKHPASFAVDVGAIVAEESVLKLATFRLRWLNAFAAAANHIVRAVAVGRTLRLHDTASALTHKAVVTIRFRQTLRSAAIVTALLIARAIIAAHAITRNLLTYTGITFH